MFDAADGAHLHGWYFPATPTPPTDRAPALIWFHGNGETVHGLEPVFAVLRPPGIALITVDYRGYGLSTGALSEDGLYHDADATWQFASHHPAIDPERIAVYGRSLGASPALYLAEHHPVKAVVLDSPFSSARDMAALHYRLVPRPLIRLSLDNVRRAAQITAPLLIFHGEADRIAPARMTRAVATAGRAEKIVTFPGAGHNDVYVADLDRYRRELHMFLESAVR